jgi:hypothetical protein
MLQSAAFKVVFELPSNIVSTAALLGQHSTENQILLRHQLMEKRLFGPMALIGQSIAVGTDLSCRANGGHDSLLCYSE